MYESDPPFPPGGGKFRNHEVKPRRQHLHPQWICMCLHWWGYEYTCVDFNLDEGRKRFRSCGHPKVIRSLLEVLRPRIPYEIACFIPKMGGPRRPESHDDLIYSGIHLGSLDIFFAFFCQYGPFGHTLCLFCHYGPLDSLFHIFHGVMELFIMVLTLVPQP